MLSISGACSRSGKTAAAVSLLRALPAGRAAAVKFTTTEDVFERCPRGTPCVVCDIDVPFRIVEDPAVLDEAGTDTARLREAGASPVVWAIARATSAAAAWAAVQQRLAGADVVIMEGSTIVSVAPAGPAGVRRPSLALAGAMEDDLRRPASPRADLVVVNRPGSDARPPSPEVLDALRRAGRGRSPSSRT